MNYTREVVDCGTYIVTHVPKYYTVYEMLHW
jgi:hypothetical protein